MAWLRALVVILLVALLAPTDVAFAAGVPGGDAACCAACCDHRPTRPAPCSADCKAGCAAAVLAAVVSPPALSAAPSAQALPAASLYRFLARPEPPPPRMVRF